MVTLQPGNVPGISVDADPNDLSSSKYTFPDWFNQDFWPAIAPGLSTWYPNYAAMTAAVPSGPGLNWIAGTSAEQTIWATINGSAWFAVGSFARSTTFAPKWYSWDGTTELNTATNGGPATDLSGSYIRNGKQVTYSFNLKRDQGSNVGTGRWRLSLPIAGTGFVNAGAGKLTRISNAGVQTDLPLTVIKIGPSRISFLKPDGTWLASNSDSWITTGAGTDQITGQILYEASQ